MKWNWVNDFFTVSLLHLAKAKVRAQSKRCHFSKGSQPSDLLEIEDSVQYVF
uniref:Uncharacterized protein n=1 Tax=Nelumbo nucifera TaxID=4432 RepID=A0A822ZGL1_NELNU|nr:TPA_asm: hypothetical protein HUJ06_001869 [Nelumbo nucifera]DAD43640.1 TPA_asm: hypothetical protein HUJ06_001870 [Nelumbo nucifera]